MADFDPNSPGAMAKALMQPVTPTSQFSPSDVLNPMAQQNLAPAAPQVPPSRLKLVPRDAKTRSFADGLITHEFDIHDASGTPVGRAALDASDPKNIYLHDIGQPGDNWIEGSNTFGPSAMRSLIPQLQQHFPEAETLSGFRISGMRGKYGGESTVNLKPKK